MKLTHLQIIEITQGLSAIASGYQKTVDGKNVERSFKLPSTVHFAVQRNLAALKPLLEAFQETKKNHFRSFDLENYIDEKGQPGQRVRIADFARYQEESERQARDIVQVKLYRLKESELNVGNEVDGKNPILPQAVVWIGRILEKDVKEPEGLVEATDEPAAGEGAKA